MFRKLTFFLVLFSFPLFSLQLHGAAPSLTADDMQLEAETQVLIAKGTATFTHEDFTIIADEIRFSKIKRKAIATGNVQVTLGELRLIGKKVVYDMADKTFEAEDFRTGSPPFFAAGKKLKGNRKEITLEDTTVYFQEPNWWGPNLSAERIVLYPEDRVETVDATIKLGSFGIFKLPKLKRPIGHLGLSVKARIGQKGDLGAYLQTQSLFPFSESLSLGASLDLYSKRGVLAGPAFSYQNRDESGNRIFSSLTSGWIKDQDDPGYDIFGSPIDNNRYFAEFQHNQKFKNDAYINSSISFWSDTEVTRDFRRNIFEEAQQPYNWLEAGFAGDNYMVSATIRPQINDFYYNTERLPEVRFDYLPTAIANTGLVHSFNASYAHLTNRIFDVWIDPNFYKLSNDRLNATYSITFPIKPTPWLAISPFVTGRLTHYDKSHDIFGGLSGHSVQQLASEFGLDINATVYGSWDYVNETWGIDGLRHISRPIIQYRYREIDRDSDYGYFLFDFNAVSNYLPLLDLDSIRSIDMLNQENVLRVGWENVLQTRAADYGSRDLLRLNFYQDFHFSENNYWTGYSSKDKWGGFYTQLTAQPADWLQVDWFNWFEPEDSRITGNSFHLSLTDNKFWHLSFFSDYLDVPLITSYEQYGVKGIYRINKRWDAYTEVRFDANSHKFTRQAYGLKHRVNNIWELEYELVFRSGSQREGDVGFNIGISLLRF